MLELPNVTLCAMGSTQIEGNINALRFSMQGIKFGDVKFITSAVDAADHYSRGEIKVEYIDPIHSIDEWNHEIIFSLGRYIDTDFALLIHPDGFIIYPESWKPEFLEYDFIGAPWPLPTDSFSYRTPDNEIIRVGNSVSLRSKRLIDLPSKNQMEWKAYHGFYNEDGYINVNNRHHYLAEGMRFAPIEVAKWFSRELDIPENEDVDRPFCFHGHFGRNAYFPNFET